MNNPAPDVQHQDGNGASKYDPYDQLPAAPSFELTSETVTDGAIILSEWLSHPGVCGHTQVEG